MPTTGVAQWTCAVSNNLGFIYIYVPASMHVVFDIPNFFDQRLETGQILRTFQSFFNIR